MLAELGAAVAGTLEVEDSADQLARLLARDFADLCIVDVVDKDGSIRRAGVASRELTNERCARADAEACDRERPRVVGSCLRPARRHSFRRWRRTTSSAGPRPRSTSARSAGRRAVDDRRASDGTWKSRRHGVAAVSHSGLWAGGLAHGRDNHPTSRTPAR